MTTNTNNRARGITVRVVPADRIDINGPLFHRYALLERPDGEVRMVHYEGVAYEVRDDKPWTWTDYRAVQDFSPLDLKELAVYDDWEKVDLADWVKVFGSRCENNFSLIRGWYLAPA